MCLVIEVIMELKELKDQILLALYDWKSKEKEFPIHADILCSDYSIAYNSDRRLIRVLKELRTAGLVKVVVPIRYKALVYDITPEGISFVEENLLSEDTLEKYGFVLTGNKAKEKYSAVVDSSVAPCFGVKTLAKCYVKQLDKIAENKKDRLCMLGIFGPWGRGKTYFFKQIKEALEERRIGGKAKLKYEFIEFNAWKYQDTPAIWAYLYETIYKEGLGKMCCFCDIALWIEQIWAKYGWRIIRGLVVYGLVCLLYWLMSEVIDLPTHIKSMMQAWKRPLLLSTAFSGLLYSIIKSPVTVDEMIGKHFKRKSYKGVLGIQSDLEQDLELLIRHIVSDPAKKKIVLYVDDIDRCDLDKMLSIVDSLRLILENPEIQERMIVICSLDTDKLIKAYALSKFDGRESLDNQTKEAKGHLDKLFVFSIGLSSIDKDQQIEYLEKLCNPDGTSPMEQGANEEQTSTSTSDDPNKKEAASIVTQDEQPDSTDKVIEEIFREYLMSKEVKDLTPRKIRIIYHRLLFANNILAARKQRVDEDLLRQVMKISISDDKIGCDQEAKHRDVLETVVPY